MGSGGIGFPLRLPVDDAELGPPKETVGRFCAPGSSMQIKTAGLLLAMTFPLVACVHETTVFHSPTGATYMKEGSLEATMPTVPPTSPESAGEPVASR